MKDLLNHKWALAESYLTRHFEVYYNALRMGHDLGKKKTIQDFFPAIESLLSIPEITGHPEVSSDFWAVMKMEIDSQSGLPVTKVSGKNIALIPVIGPLTKYGDLCSMGMQDYQSLLNKANASPSVDGIVLIMDTPGGTVDGTPEFGLAVKNNPKPVGVFGDNMVASAGMWIASQAGVIVGNKNNPTEFGSHGVLMSLPNYQNVIDAGNLPKVEIFRATQSTDKARVNAIEPITQDGRDQLQSELDAIASQFIDTVKNGRGDVLDVTAPGLFTGKMFDVYTAKKIGLIDSVGTLQTAVNKVAELAKQKYSGATSGTGQGTNKNANTMKFPKISSLFGSKSKEAKEVTMKVTADGLQSEDTASLEAAEQKVADMEAEATRLKQEATAKDEQITKLTATVSEQTTQITSLNTEKSKLSEENTTLKAELAKKPTGQLTTVISKEEQERTVAADGKGKTEPVESSITAEGRKIVEQNEKAKSILV